MQALKNELKPYIKAFLGLVKIRTGTLTKIMLSPRTTFWQSWLYGQKCYFIRLQAFYPASPENTEAIPSTRLELLVFVLARYEKF